MIELTNEQKVARGRHAEALLTDELLNEAFTTATQANIDAWMEAEDPQVRERAWYMVRALAEVRGALLGIVTGGQYAAGILDKEAKRHPREV